MTENGRAAQPADIDVAGILEGLRAEVRARRLAQGQAKEEPLERDLRRSGTLPDQEVLLRLRADTWLRSHPEAPQALKLGIRQQLREAFYCDNDEWKGMVLGQTRVVLLQTLQGLKHAA